MPKKQTASKLKKQDSHLSVVSINARSDSSLPDTVSSIDLIPPFSTPALRSRAGVPQTARPVPVALHRVGAGLHADHRQDAGTQPATDWHTLGPSDVRVRASTLYTQTHCKNILSTLPDITIQTVASILRILSPCYPFMEKSEEIRTDPRPTGDLVS